MKSIIICEGKTDAIILSYYLSKTDEWIFLSKKESQCRGISERILEFGIENSMTQEFSWYINPGEDLLCIYAVGGITAIKDGFAQVLDINSMSNSEPFERMVLLFDRDDEHAEHNILEDISRIIVSNSLEDVNLENNEWAELQYSERRQPLLILPLVIPFDTVGTLENFLLSCRKEIDYCENTLVEQCDKFTTSLETIENIKERYLKRRGIKSKISFGTYFSVVSPHRTFDAGDKILRSIPWENYSGFNDTFLELHKLCSVK
ncbi:DUF3226 domain-containing protein [Christensenella tenuis]|jgi:hypothetical protein|uniref:DUF4276 family protein n=1 Tax=Christensenella tenuis TaxID=2763033 RepID=A0ABR7EFV8_9FIRM|nr:DUF3226 domain-containing protein [Christensenella tenuis]MBC5648645.1 hypothetical protein [Christensenella tenuis]